MENTTKTCKTCNTPKTLENFHTGNNYKNGYRPHCIPCTNEKHSQKPEIIANRAKAAEYKKDAPVRAKVKYQAKKVEKQAYQREYFKNKPEASRKSSLKYYHSLKSSEVTLTKPEALLLDRYYQVACSLTTKTGYKWVVDHIVEPKDGGKHHPSNLQIMTDEDNKTKGSSYDGTPENNSWLDNILKNVSILRLD